jgi:ArsR family transcriptional regulator
MGRESIHRQMSASNQATEFSLNCPRFGYPPAVAGPLALDLRFHIIETMKGPEAIEALSALASEARLAVYRLLVKRGPEGYTPSELVGRLDLPAPTLSFHLKGLAQAGLVVSRREGRNLHYSPNFERMNALVGFLTENCCSLAEQACGTDCAPVAEVTQRRKRA